MLPLDSAADPVSRLSSSPIQSTTWRLPRWLRHWQRQHSRLRAGESQLISTSTEGILNGAIALTGPPGSRRAARSQRRDVFLEARHRQGLFTPAATMYRAKLPEPWAQDSRPCTQLVETTGVAASPGWQPAKGNVRPLHDPAVLEAAVEKMLFWAQIPHFSQQAKK